MNLTTTTLPDALAFCRIISQSTWNDWDDVAWIGPGENANLLPLSDIEVWALDFGHIIVEEV